MKIYVDASARCDGNGSEFRPFKRINEAAKIAVAGDEVLVKPGIYKIGRASCRERVSSPV